MKTKTKQKQLLTKKQQEFFSFVQEKVMPYFEENKIKFDTINPTVLQDEWPGNDVLIMIPYGDRMEPWFLRAINECYAYEDKNIYVVCGAKVNSNAFHRFVFPFASSIAFVRRGKRPTAIIKFSNGCEYKGFIHAVNDTIACSIGNIETNIGEKMIKTLLDEEKE